MEIPKFVVNEYLPREDSTLLAICEIQETSLNDHKAVADRIDFYRMNGYTEARSQQADTVSDAEKIANGWGYSDPPAATRHWAVKRWSKPAK